MTGTGFDTALLFASGGTLAYGLAAEEQTAWDITIGGNPVPAERQARLDAGP